MGRAARWVKSLLGGGRKSSTSAPPPPPPPLLEKEEHLVTLKEKKRWGFVRSIRELDRNSMVAEEERNKRTIAVVSATAAVAEAAVAAANAAAAAVSLTNGGVGGAKREHFAAVKIQSAFRGYLARRALRALRGLVKLQALVRGNIVRKQAAETLRCMQALVRAQARARTTRAEKSPAPPLAAAPPMTPEKFENPVVCRRLDILKKSSSKSSGRNWLDRWMEERYVDDEKAPKIVEIDTGKSRQRGHTRSSCYPATSDQKSRSFATVVGSPSSVDVDRCFISLRFPAADCGDVVNGYSQEFCSATSRPGSSRRRVAGGPLTPAKSECSRSLLATRGIYSDHPNYMACTESWRAKVRSVSAPRQRPSPEFEISAAMEKQLTAAVPAMWSGRLGMPMRI